VCEIKTTLRMRLTRCHECYITEVSQRAALRTADGAREYPVWFDARWNVHKKGGSPAGFIQFAARFFILWQQWRAWQI
jgi:hypothetical protein